MNIKRIFVKLILHTPWGRTHSVKLYNMLGIKGNGGYFYTLIA